MRIMRLLFGVVVAIAVLSQANATVVERKTLDQLVAEAPVVVIATVIGVRYTSLQGSERPYTVYSFRLQEVVAGEGKLGHGKGQSFELPFAGGLTPKNQILMFAGMPEFKLGETYLLLLRGGEWRLNPIAGWHQGAFRIVAIDRQLKAVLSLDDAVLVGIDGGYLKYVRPTVRGAETAPKTQSREPGIKLDRPGQGPAMPAKSIYTEDNVEALAAEDAKRAAAAREATPKLSPQQGLISLLDGAKPVTLDAFLGVIKQSLAKHTAAQTQVKFSLTPAVLPDKIEAARPGQKPR